MVNISKITFPKLLDFKKDQNKITCLTVYDACFSSLFSRAGIEVLLVGDTLGQVFQGWNSTIPVKIKDMVYHVECVARGNEGALILADLPFMSYAEPQQALKNAAKVIQAGAHGVKIEGGMWLSETIFALTQHGIPVCAHIGLTPQFVHQFGGYKVQGKTEEAAEKLLQTALAFQEAGCGLLVLECVPEAVAKKITQQLTIPTIGIGAGVDCDGQVLVCYDMLGLTTGKLPRFVKNFMQSSVEQAVKDYITAVKEKTYPAKEHTYLG